jgi:hypothetical protein
MPAELQIAFALISTATVVGGFIFAAYQFVAFVRQRRQETALTLMKTTQPPELFSRSIRKIFELPDAASPDSIHALGPELEQALIETFVKFENLGYLVYSRAIPLHMADDLIGGMVRLTWRKCRGYIGQFRAVTPTAFEWFEWLFDRMEQYPAAADSSVGAHVSRKEWKP